MNIEVKQADYRNAKDAQALVDVLNAYACDPMGGGEALSPEVKSKLADSLAAIPGAFSILVYVDGKAAGLTNCFMGFSTFKCKPLVNIHDVAVMPEFRGLGLSRLMIDKVEEIARERTCCKITLEVLEGNTLAQAAYRKFGFSGYELNEADGKAMFWEKSLSE
ncbi:GNAT family N-acetyltransferase [Pseudoteredinibacter isoporae]|uniref:Ribosomal protein S18 acetylase RimI-like enzyme n=1 Tax=Pseudoteredinibacter isoporae TaxID=570281 RepID=A0A7X0MUT4_9GAMM|nr:GNAT family N-acetyltransferase [Pseudoteredinibacter isoporae]MBB6520365.1 ribosomal protein S18 acetylase RimI-like enzyme [Pseudoteredinibacter isoporae]NHO85935.1 GNAT family N-acetyltransferase [Pseudoteredinibacter isoporae]NIB25613.1 GNAT family N-acetyltransferase [Pseudoteredinibacter isoporae]